MVISKEYLEEKCIKQRMMLKEVAEELGCEVKCVSYYFNKYGLKKPTKYSVGTIVKGMEVISVRKNDKNKYIWNTRCVVCGYEKERQNNHFSGCIKCLHQSLKNTNEYRIGLYNAFVYGAKLRNIPFNLTYDYVYNLFLEQDRKCALTGLPIKFSLHESDKGSGTTASLDRISSLKPYEIGNVQWVHKAVNRMKNVLTQEDFLIICSLVANKHPDLDLTQLSDNIIFQPTNREYK